MMSHQKREHPNLRLTTYNMLLSNTYVIVISLDFTKAFDMLRHYTLGLLTDNQDGSISN